MEKLLWREQEAPSRRYREGWISYSDGVWIGIATYNGGPPVFWYRWKDIDFERRTQ